MSSIIERIRARFALVQRDRDDMHGYQEQLVEFGKAHPFSLFLVDMGLGKTISSLTLIRDLILETSFDAAPVLVIAPLKVARNVWPEEVRLWRHTAWMTCQFIRPEDDHPELLAARKKDNAERKDRLAQRNRLIAQGMSDEKVAYELGPLHETVANRRIMEQLARSKALIHVINREQVEWLCNLFGPKWPYRTVFVDESDSFQDNQSHRFKALAKMRNSTGLITRMHLLTATPAAESYMNLWAQTYLLDQGKRFGKAITRFRSEFFEYNKYNHTYKLRPGSETAILEKIADITIVMKRDEYLPRDKPTIIPRYVHLTETELGMVRTLEREMVLTLPNGAELEAKTAGHLANMLLQLASGALYETEFVADEDDEDADLVKVKRTHQIHDHKIEALREIYAQCRSAGEPLLVAYHFKSSLDKLRKAFPKAVVMSKDGREEKAWNKRKIPMMFVHPQSAGHGLNLQHGGSNMVVFDMIHSLRYYLQLIGRIDRQGQTRPVVVQVLMSKGTRDEDAFAGLQQKEDNQDHFFKLLKRLIRKYREAKKKAALLAAEQVQYDDEETL